MHGIFLQPFTNLHIISLCNKGKQGIYKMSMETWQHQRLMSCLYQHYDQASDVVTNSAVNKAMTQMLVKQKRNAERWLLYRYNRKQMNGISWRLTIQTFFVWYVYYTAKWLKIVTKMENSSVMLRQANNTDFSGWYDSILSNQPCYLKAIRIKICVMIKHREGCA